MSDYLWPSTIVPNSTEWRLISNTGAFTSPLSGTTRTISRGGDRWACSLTFNNVNSTRRAMLRAFLARMRGQANRVWVPDHSYVRRGVYASSELLGNGDFSESVSGWVVSGSMVLSWIDGSARMLRTSTTGGTLRHSAALTVVNGASYALRYAVRGLRGTAYSHAGLVGSTLGGFDYLTMSGATGLGLFTGVYTSAATSAYVSCDFQGSSGTAGDFLDFDFVSLARCLLVNGASQTGSVLNVTSLGATASGTLMPGDFVQVGNYLHMVTEPLDSNAYAGGALNITPPLRSSPANGAPVIISRPMCRMLLTDNTVGWSNSPGGFSSMTVDLVEDIA